MVQSQLLDEPLAEADLSVGESDYFGRPISDFENLGGFPYFDPNNGVLTRHSYVYQRIYQIGSGKQKEYGGIQLRGRIHGYGEPGQPIREWIERAAHRAAYMYDSGVETRNYGPPKKDTRGTKTGDGYLTGFNSVESFRNWEREAIEPGEQQTAIGVIDWSTEIYVDDSFDEAYLSGIAQGIANPYRVDSHHEPGEPPQHVPPTKWRIGWEDGRDPSEYFVRPEPYSDASKRYREGAGKGKTVYVNEKPIGSLGPKGRVWLRPEYGRGDPRYSKGSWGTYYSRKGLVEETAATYQAIRKGGVLYQTGETRDGVYLTTSRAKPDGWKGVDPDEVPVDMEAREGKPDRTVWLLRLQDPDAGLPVECRRDDQIIKHMGMSRPTYQHRLDDGQAWPEGWSR